MADKAGGRRTAGQDLGASSPDRIRNVVLVGPGGSGKTTLVETLLASAGAIPRAGTIQEGSTVCDFEESERAHERSISLAIAPVVHRDTKINFVDTPGYADFVGEVRAGLRAADCALFVIAASEAVDDATTALWRECAEVGMPRAVVITKLDQARADYDGVLAAAQAAFGDKVLPLYVPVRDGGEVTGLVDLMVGSTGRGGRPRGPARRPHRGDHRGVRGRDPDGPLPRRRGHLPRQPHQGPRDGRRQRQLPPGRPGLLRLRCRLRGAPRPRRRRLPVAARARLARGLHPGRGARPRRSTATREAPSSPRSSRPPATSTSAGSASCASSPAR